MKKYTVIILMLSFVLMCGCSVQEKMNSDLFFERLSALNNEFDYENIEIIYDDKNCVCFAKDKNSIDYIFEFGTNDTDDINKISFACNKTDKAENFVKYIGDIISVYAPKENKVEIIYALTENGKIKPSYTYYETQWYYWSAFSDKNGLYFSVINKKISQPLSVQYSLKPNDKIEF